jgi:predicted DCC family thiol-disulfide oxidoreductase YuxK
MKLLWLPTRLGAALRRVGLTQRFAPPRYTPRVRRTFDFLRDRYAALDLRSLALFRIAFALVLLVDLVRRIPVLVPFYSDLGVLPGHFALFRPQDHFVFSLFFLCRTPAEAALGFALAGAAYTMLLFGYRTRIAQIASFVAVTSLHSRNIMLENGGDVVMNLLACWSLFLPLGRRFSWDALRESLRARHEHSPADLADRTGLRPPAGERFVSLACLALVAQLAVIYGFNAGNKVGATWRNGTAVHYVLEQDWLVTGIGLYCRHHLPLWAIRTLTWGTWLCEATLPILVLLPVGQDRARRGALVAIWILHGGIGLCTNIKVFQLSMMVFPLLLCAAADWQALASWHRRRKGELVVVYDTDCGICHASARLLARLDPLSQLRLLGNDDDALPPGVTPTLAAETICVVDPSNGRCFVRARAVGRILRTLPGWAPLGLLVDAPGIAQLCDAGYRLVARNRHRISAALGLAACGIRATVAPGAAVAAGPLTSAGAPPKRRLLVLLRESAVALVMIGCASQLVVETPLLGRWVPVRQPDLLAAIVHYPRIFQGWAMFASDPPPESGIMVIDALTASGRHVDPRTPTWEPPRQDVSPPGGRYPMQAQWSDYSNRIHLARNEPYRAGLRDWLLRAAELARRPPGDRIVSFEVRWLERPLAPPGQPADASIRRHLLLHHP